MRGHVDAETLAALREGLLSRRRAARVSAHLAACPRCAQADASLAGITALLASAPAPPMPAGLSARIEAALAAEAAARAAAGALDGVAAGGTAGAGDGPAPEETAGAGRPPSGRTPAGPRRHRSTRGRARPRSWLALRVGAVTAAVAVIVGGGYGVSRLLSSGITSGASSSAGGSGSHAVAGSGRAPSGLSPQLGSGATANAGGLPVVRSGTNYRPGQLGTQVTAVLARHPLPRAHASQGAKGAAPAPFGTLNSLRACVRRVSGGVTPRLVDLATYQGRPATVIVVPAGGNRLRVFVVRPECTGAATDVLAKTSVTTAP